MRGFILAAGFGTRLRPITDHLPKALVPLAGKPLLSHALEFLSSCSVTEIGVNVHYLSEQIRQFRSSSPFPFDIFHEEPEIRGTGGALRFAHSFLSGRESCMVVNVDIVAQFDIHGQIRCFEDSNDCCRLLAWENGSGTGTISYHSRNGKYAFSSRNDTGSSGIETADFIGMALYRSEFLKLLDSNDFSIVPVWSRAVARGMPVSVGLVRHGYWRDLGNPAALAQAHFDIIDGSLELPPPPSLHLDRVFKRCYPAAWGKSLYDTLGEYCWVEEQSYTPGHLERTVILPGAVRSEGTPLRNSLCTPWGVIAINE